MRPIEKITDQKPEDSITQKLELFIIEDAAAPLVCMRTVRESLSQQSGIFECIAELHLQSREIRHKRIYAEIRGPHPRIPDLYCPIFAPALFT